jgi:hypothetical protein
MNLLSFELLGVVGAGIHLPAPAFAIFELTSDHDGLRTVVGVADTVVYEAEALAGLGTEGFGVVIGQCSKQPLLSSADSRPTPDHFARTCRVRSSTSRSQGPLRK